MVVETERNALFKTVLANSAAWKNANPALPKNWPPMKISGLTSMGVCSNINRVTGIVQDESGEFVWLRYL